MTTLPESRATNGFLGFLSTIPGLLTACAALLTAFGTVAGVYLASVDGAEPVSGPAAPLAAPPEAPPAFDGGVTDVTVPDGTGLPAEDPNQILLDSCALGDDDACAQVLDALVWECHDGFLLSCDVLYAVTPYGSDLEWYGGTCGGRLDFSYAGNCRDQ